MGIRASKQGLLLSGGTMTGAIEVIAGTASAPAIADSNGSGIFFRNNAHIVLEATSFGNIEFNNDGVRVAFIEQNGTYNAGINGLGGVVSNQDASATVPNFRPSVGDPNTGIGAAGADQLSLIAGGVEVARAITTELDMQLPIGLRSYTVATIPTATAGHFIYVSDETGGAIPAFGDGTNFRRVSDRTIVA